MMWLRLVSDSLIALAYLTISVSLLRLLHIRKDLPFHRMFMLFAAFILSCAAIHILAVITLWIPVYRLEAVIKAATAFLSVAAAALLLYLSPQIANLPDVAQWRRSNEELKADIANRRKLHEDTAMLSAIVTNSEDAIVSRTLQGTITSWNVGAERLFGFSPEQAIGQPIGLIIPPERMGDEAYLNYVRNRPGVETFETLRMHKDGHRIEVSFIESPIRDESGKVIGASKIFRDIGELKRSHEKFRRVVEAAPNAIIMMNGAGRITLVNARAEEWFAYTRDELIGQPVDILLPERFWKQPEGESSNFVAHPALLGPGELYGRRKDGGEFPIEVGLNFIDTEDGPMVLSSVVDVTKRKQRQRNERTEQLCNTKELEEFAYAASHDLKAPLRVIDNCSKWIEEDLQPHLSTDTREKMTLLRGRVRRMEKLLDDLLEYARIGHIEDAKCETIAGDTMMNNILALLSPHGFTVDVSPSFAWIQVRAMPLQQVLLNLVGNAIKHHDKKQGHIEVTAEDCGSHYAFAVKDDGPGIPAEFHEQIFKMFETLRPRDQVEGSGMGLALVRKHVAFFGGSIDLESVEGQGSIFRFTWPKPKIIRKEAV